MPQSATRPRLAILADQEVTAASRAGRTAIAAARDGWDVTVLSPGSAEVPKEARQSALGPVSLVRIPVGSALREDAARRRRGHRMRRFFTQAGLRDATAQAGALALHRAWVREAGARAGDMGLPARWTFKVWIRLRRAAHRLRMRLCRWEARRDRSPVIPLGDWRADLPELLDQDLAVGPVLEDLKPDLIHVLDVSMLATASRSSSRLRTRGLKAPWIYDASVRTEQAAIPAQRQAAAYGDLEQRFAPEADAVTAATSRIARLLASEHRLRRAPLVVQDAPAGTDAPMSGHPLPEIRNICGLYGAGPLWVYAGPADAGARLNAAVSALAELPGHHFALACSADAPALEPVLQKAEEAGVRDRVHTPHADPARRPSYLSSADAAVAVCTCGTNEEPALVMLIAEYVQAGLPVVVLCGREAPDCGDRLGPAVTVVDAGSPSAFAKAVVDAVDPASRPTAPLRDEHAWEHRSAPLAALYRELSGTQPLTPRTDLTWTGETQDARKPSRPVPTWTPLGGTPIRLGLAPANYAGQLASFAHAVCRSRPDVSAQVVMAASAGSFGYPADVQLDAAKLGRLTIQLAQVERVFRNYTHLIADAFLPVLGRLNGSHLEGDLPALLRTSIKVALLGHGSEVRHPLRHMERFEHSLFRDAPEGMVERLTGVTERNRRVAEEFGLPTFVTTPDLLDDLPMATWAPLVVDVDAFACDRPVMERRRPVVLHAPSKRWTKGTDRVLPVLTDLHDRGVIEFRLAEQVDWSGMRDLVQDADIIIDQFAIGTYGTFACEGMAAGKPVVAWLTDTAADIAGVRPPIVNATPDSLRSALESLLDDRHEAALIGERSARFARECHDGTRTAAVLADFLS
ncbi:glycosyltransferase [Streptomyces sp. SYSU K21746]